MLIHIVTEKGRGYSYAEAAQDKYHGVSTFDVASGQGLGRRRVRSSRHDCARVGRHVAYARVCACA